MISEAEVEQYLAWLVATDDEIGKLRGHMEAMEYARKLTRSRALLDADHKSSELRMAYAESRPEYEAACKAHADAVARFESRRAQRMTWALHIDVWRSQNAARRQGNV